MTPAQYIAHLQTAIKATHGVESRHVETVAVVETYQGKTVWEGDVEVFDLIGHPKAKRAYAWAYDHQTGSRTLAVLELPPVISPKTAVQVAIAGQIRAVEKANKSN
jgi:hypothetical protein